MVNITQKLINANADADANEEVSTTDLIASILNSRCKSILNNAIKTASKEMNFCAVESLVSYRDQYFANIETDDDELDSNNVDLEKFPRGIEVVVKAGKDVFSLVYGALKNSGKIISFDKDKNKIVVYLSEDDFQKFTKNSGSIVTIKLIDQKEKTCK